MPQVSLLLIFSNLLASCLLAVEAIKLENLRGMRARIQWIYRIFNPPVVRGPEADDPDLKKVVIAIWLLGLATQLLFLLLLFVIGRDQRPGRVFRNYTYRRRELVLGWTS